MLRCITCILQYHTIVRMRVCIRTFLYTYSFIQKKYAALFRGASDPFPAGKDGLHFSSCESRCAWSCVDAPKSHLFKQDYIIYKYNVAGQLLWTIFGLSLILIVSVVIMERNSSPFVLLQLMDVKVASFARRLMVNYTSWTSPK